MIFSSAARTLHLYAETRAEHNQWVTGLAKLCPEAFIKLKRAWAIIFVRIRVGTLDDQIIPHCQVARSLIKNACYKSNRGRRSTGTPSGDAHARKDDEQLQFRINQ